MAARCGGRARDRWPSARGWRRGRAWAVCPSSGVSRYAAAQGIQAGAGGDGEDPRRQPGRPRRIEAMNAANHANEGLLSHVVDGRRRPAAHQRATSEKTVFSYWRTSAERADGSPRRARASVSSSSSFAIPAPLHTACAGRFRSIRRRRRRRPASVDAESARRRLRRAGVSLAGPFGDDVVAAEGGVELRAPPRK